MVAPKSLLSHAGRSFATADMPIDRLDPAI
jgi:hypothetical protein